MMLLFENAVFLFKKKSKEKTFWLISLEGFYKKKERKNIVSVLQREENVSQKASENLCPFLSKSLCCVFFVMV